VHEFHNTTQYYFGTFSLFFFSQPIKITSAVSENPCIPFCSEMTLPNQFTVSNPERANMTAKSPDCSHITRFSRATKKFPPRSLPSLHKTQPNSCNYINASETPFSELQYLEEKSSHSSPFPSSLPSHSCSGNISYLRTLLLSQNSQLQRCPQNRNRQ
jgi:hypothetical protein